MKQKIIIFANTLWFLDKFKYELIQRLIKKFDIDCFYLRKGPAFDKKRIDKLILEGVTFRQFSILLGLKIFFNNIILKFRSRNLKVYRLIIFTLGPILISSLIFINLRSSTIIVLEGLGRVFTSRLIIFRILKRIILLFYKLIFKDCRKIVTLNHSDSTFLSELGIVPIHKIKVIPGTGINIEDLDKIDNYKKRETKYIDFIGRLIPDKGFNIFLNTKMYLNFYNLEFFKDYSFRIITPQSDIDKLPVKDKLFISNLGIELKPYLPDQLVYLKNTKAILFPTKYGEGLSRVVMEAIYLEIPLLVSRNQGTEEILPFDYKYFIKSNNPSTLSEQLQELINDHNYFDIIAPYRKKLRKYYSSKVSIEIFLDLLNNK